MKTYMMAASLFAATLIGVLAVAAHQGTLFNTPVQPIANNLNNQSTTPVAQPPKIELVFALDTTGSMGGLIQAAKEKIWSIASTMASAQPAPDISIGLVAYRDRGDEYITRKVDLSANLDAIYAELLDFTAAGGGDGPESVNAALYDAVNEMNWSENPNSYKVIFLVGDAPGHDDYQDDIPFNVTLAQAKNKGIIVNTIQAGQDPTTTSEWRKIAALGLGDSFQVGQQGSAVAISTPFDESIALASQEVDDTRLYYGNDEVKVSGSRLREQRNKLYEESTPSSLARRAKFNASGSGYKNVNDKGELLDAIAENRVVLDSLSKAELPAEMQSMTLEKQQEFVQQKLQKRKLAEQKIKQLTEKRDAFIEAEIGQRKDLKSSLDEQLLGTLKVQAGKKGIEYADTENSY